MSTFKGIVSEFPRIRIDFFRLDPSQPPPLACFLSHIHSDHLQGLESLKSPFVYCSAATRQLLLRMEKYPHRMNFMRGVLEARKQHYQHLKLVLKAIPLHCPTEIELGPLEKIRVSLFDANHCPGAVMFLVQGDHNAVLYTGDMRSEPWWVNSIVRNPILLPYTSGLRQLSRIYLDTTFARQEDALRKFSSKAEGIRELLDKVSKYPPNTRFYLGTWTLGYEEVWIAMSSFLKSRVHVDSYQSRLYRYLAEADPRSGLPEYSALSGFHVGNHYQPGCLTRRSDVKIHSCEPGTACHAALRDAKDVVWITPIVARTKDGPNIPEEGAGGGGGDMYQAQQLELFNNGTLQQLEELYKHPIVEPAYVARYRSIFQSAIQSGDGKMSLAALCLELEKEIPLQEFLSRLTAMDQNQTDTKWRRNVRGTYPKVDTTSPTIHFPFARHSSYGELCDFVSIFKPYDIFPCTVNEDQWTEALSIGTLFGHLCSGRVFAHDERMRGRLHRMREGEVLSRTFLEESHAGESQVTAVLDSPIPAFSRGPDMVQELQRCSQTLDCPFPRGMIFNNAVEIDTTGEQFTKDSLAAIRRAYENRRFRADGKCPASYSCSDKMNDHDVAGQDTKTMLSTSSHGSEYSGPRSDRELFQVRMPTESRWQFDDTSENKPACRSQRDSSFANTTSPRGRNWRDPRREAYRAAKRTLETSDSGAWDDLGITCMGTKGYGEAEDEL